MRLKVPAVVAVNTEDLTTPDFSSIPWKEFVAGMFVEGVDLRLLNELDYQTQEIDGDQSLFTVILDARALRNMWLRSEERSYLEVLGTGGWINDCVIPPHEWQCDGRGESAYWYWGPLCRYTIGITAVDIENAEIIV